MTNDKRAALLVAVLIFTNIFDAASTLYILKSGPDVGMELNPLLAWLYMVSGARGFLFAKMGYLAFVVVLIWHNRDLPSVRLIATIVTLVYVALAVFGSFFLALHWTFP